jgi:hypothetical protein
MINAVSDAAAEITAALLDYPGSPAVNVRLDGDEVAIDVHAAVSADEPRRDEGDPSARISLRLSEALKSEIDAAAEREGVSVNTWLVRAASAALRPGPFGPGFGAFVSGFESFGAAGGQQGGGRQRGGNQHRITGWING